MRVLWAAWVFFWCRKLKEQNFRTPYGTPLQAAGSALLKSHPKSRSSRQAMRTHSSFSSAMASEKLVAESYEDFGRPRYMNLVTGPSALESVSSVLTMPVKTSPEVRVTVIVAASPE